MLLLRGVANHCINNELLKEYFYRWKGDNIKAVFDTIALVCMENARGQRSLIK